MPVQLSDAEKVRFLRMTTFGSTPDLLDDFGNASREEWIDRQVAVPSGRSNYSWGNEMKDVVDDGVLPPPLFGIMDGQEYNVNQMWRSYIESPDQFRKRAACALLEIFVVNARPGAIGIGRNIRTSLSYVDTLEAHAFGNFFDLLKAVTLHPSMGYYLSHIGNEKAVYGADGTEVRIPDENYAREILQLFSIGLHELNLDGTLRLGRNRQPIETYSQDDVFNLARVFTGWDLDTSIPVRRDRLHNPMKANAAKHSPEEKNFLGLRIRAGTGPEASLDQALRHIVNHQNVGPFIAKQLIQRFVTSNPSRAYVQRVAQRFNNNGRGVRGDMLAVFKEVLCQGDEAIAPRPPNSVARARAKANEPMIRLSAVARYLGLSSDELLYPIANLTDPATGIGQSPLKSPSVFNFFRPGYSPPQSRLAALGYVAPELQVATGTQVIGSINTINEFIWRSNKFMDRDPVVSKRLRRMARRDIPGLVDDASLHLTGRTLQADYRARLISAIGSASGGNWGKVRFAVVGVASSPEFLVQN